MNFRHPTAIVCLPVLLLSAAGSIRAEETQSQIKASSPVTDQTCLLPAKRMARLELIFGLASKTGPVTPRAWAAFVNREVTPRFPEGFSVFDGYGQWRNAYGIVSKEASRLVLIWYLPDASSEAKIEAIRAAYKARFHQESVLRADATSCVSF